MSSGQDSGCPCAASHEGVPQAGSKYSAGRRRSEVGCTFRTGKSTHDASLAILDRPRRHLHRHRGPHARRRAAHPQAAVRRPRALRRRGGRGHPPPARAWRRRADHARAGGVGEDGHHGGDQRPARAQGRPHRARDHARLPRRAAHRLPGAAAAVRSPHRAAGAAVRARDRGRRARGRARRGAGAARRSRPGRQGCRPRSTPASGPAPSCSCTATGMPPTSAAAERLAQAAGYTQVSVSHASAR